MPKKHYVYLGIILLIGLVLRIQHIKSEMLWQDEAETVIQSLQVLSDGYPNGTFRGAPIYETGSTIAAKNNSIFAYANSNFYPSNIEKRKGWVTYFFLAPFIKIFGVNELSARLPFVAVSLATIILIYLFSECFLISRRLGLLAAFLYAINFPAFVFEGEARYYSLESLFLIGGLYFIYRWSKELKISHLYWFFVFLFFEFNTHLVACLCLLIFWLYLYKKKRGHWNVFREKGVALPLAVFTTLSFIWFIAVRFWDNFASPGSMVFRNLLNGFAIVILILGLIKLSQYLNRKLRWRLFDQSEKSFLISFILTGLTLSIFISSSNFIRSYYPFLAPLTILLVAYLADINKNRPQIIKFITVLLLLIFPIIFLMFGGGWIRLSANWLKPGIAYLKSSDYSSLPVYSSYQDLPLRLYDNIKALPAWPIKESYFNDLSRGFILFLNTRQDWHNQVILTSSESVSKLNFGKRLQFCHKKILSNSTYLYYCPAIK